MPQGAIRVMQWSILGCGFEGGIACASQPRFLLVSEQLLHQGDSLRTGQGLTLLCAFS